MRKRFYEAFTLVEMLIVMGILIILMVIGITAGRFAINRANDVAHQNAVDQIYQGLQAYYTDNRVFPGDVCGLAGNEACTVAELIGTTDTPGLLGEYLDQGAFNGGTSATYHYFVEEGAQQSVLVCVTLGGVTGDATLRAVYCNGNGFGVEDLISGITVSTKSMDDITTDGTPGAAIVALPGSDWDGETWQ